MSANTGRLVSFRIQHPACSSSFTAVRSLSVNYQKTWSVRNFTSISCSL